MAAMQSRATRMAVNTTAGMAVLTSGKNTAPQTIANASAHR